MIWELCAWKLISSTFRSDLDWHHVAQKAEGLKPSQPQKALIEQLFTSLKRAIFPTGQIAISQGYAGEMAQEEGSCPLS